MTHNKQPNISLSLFVAMWQQGQGLATPYHHVAISQWLEKHLHQGLARLLLLAFRGSGKSTLTALCCAWMLWRNPNVRILVLAAEQNLAEQLVLHVRGIIEQHPLTKSLIPAQKNQWARDRFVVERPYLGRDPSLRAAGITGNITGSRADVIICDDVEVPNTTATADLRQQLVQRLQELDFILTPQGSVLYLGTPHAVESLYDASHAQSPLKHYERLVVPAYNAHKQPMWPARFGDDYLQKLQQKVGSLAFDQHMLLKIQALKSYYFDVSQLQWYDDLPDYTEVHGAPVLKLAGRRIVSAQCWWDPAFASDDRPQGDASVVACVYRDDENHVWVQGMQYIKVQANDSTDAATQQCRAVVQFLQQHFVPKICVEMNGIGQFLPDILRRELSLAKLPISVVASHTHRAKNTRLIEAFDALMAAKRLHVHNSVQQTPWLQEMQQWRPTKTNQKDDGLDAVASAILADPVRLSVWPKPPSTWGNWRPSTKAFMAQTDN